MHAVISNAWRGDPYRIDTLFMYMANMAWNSSMNTAGTIAMLTDKDDNGDYKIPFIIYSDAYFSETVAYSDLVLPDTTYLERHDCISLLDRPISHADGPGDAIRYPVIAPDRDVRPFQSVLLDLGARLGLPGMADDTGKPRYRDYADYIVRHERTPGVVRSPAGAATMAAASARRAQLNQLDRYIANGATGITSSPERKIFQDGEPRLSRVRGQDGVSPRSRSNRVPALLRAAAALPTRGARPRRGGAAAQPTRTAEPLFRSAADLVRTAGGTSRRWRCL
jgi:anaerobic selenocysteine-containing dehydrogenase